MSPEHRLRRRRGPTGGVKSRKRLCEGCGSLWERSSWGQPPAGPGGHATAAPVCAHTAPPQGGAVDATRRPPRRAGGAARPLPARAPGRRLLLRAGARGWAAARTCCPQSAVCGPRAPPPPPRPCLLQADPAQRIGPAASDGRDGRKQAAGAPSAAWALGGQAPLSGAQRSRAALRTAGPLRCALLAQRRRAGPVCKVCNASRALLLVRHRSQGQADLGSPLCARAVHPGHPSYPGLQARAQPWAARPASCRRPSRSASPAAAPRAARRSPAARPQTRARPARPASASRRRWRCATPARCVAGRRPASSARCTRPRPPGRLRPLPPPPPPPHPTPATPPQGARAQGRDRRARALLHKPHEHGALARGCGARPAPLLGVLASALRPCKLGGGRGVRRRLALPPTRRPLCRRRRPARLP